MKLETLTREQCQQVRVWRNEELQFLRTPYMITEKMQDDFFDNVINNRDSKHRYFAIVDSNAEGRKQIHDGGKVYQGVVDIEGFVGMCGITNIEWENGTAEISLIIEPRYRGLGYGGDAVDLLLDEAFKTLRLLSVYGEVYDCGNTGFWEKMVESLNGFKTQLPFRKYYDGIMFNSMWFSFGRRSVELEDKI